MRILLRVGFARARIPGAREDSHPLRNQFIWDRTDLGALNDFVITVPPLSEQRAIVAYIEKETAKLDALREATERTIGLLKERRAALIAAAVTGKLNVSCAA